MPKKTISHLLKTSAIIIPLALQWGCSSDSGSVDAPSANQIPTPVATPTVTAPVSQTNIVGRAVKGILKFATVEFYNINDGVIADTPFASTSTDEQGEFSVTLENESIAELIFVKVKASSTAPTEMICDAVNCGLTTIVDGIDDNENGSINFGETLYLTNNFALTSIISRFNNAEDLSVSITPLTHLATQNAIADANLSLENIEYHMGLLTNLFDLPKTISQLFAIDVTAIDTLLTSDEANIDDGTLLYSVYSTLFARYASQNNITLSESIVELTEKLQPTNGGFNRELVITVLESALETARAIASQDASLLTLITNIELLIHRYKCQEDLVNEQTCDEIIIPPQPPTPEPGTDELALVKNFVADFREWARDVTLEATPAIDGFTSRVDLMNEVWQNDFKELSSSLNDLLPGIAQMVARSYYFPTYPYDIGDNALRMNWEGLTFELDLDDNTLTIRGMRRNVEVDMDIVIPPRYDYMETQFIEVVAGRLSHASTDLILTEGSRIQATYAYNTNFNDVANSIVSPYYSLKPENLSFDANFFLQAKYAVKSSQKLDFESANSAIDVTGDWVLTSDRASKGSYSLRSKNITHNQSSSTSVTINTIGGYVSFDYALESESSWDYFNFYIDGRNVLRESGYYPGFRTRSFYLSPGEHTLTWQYSKDGSVDRYSDAAWIDNIRFPLVVDEPGTDNTITTKTILNGQLSVSAESLNTPLLDTGLQYLPGNINLRAVFTNDFTEENAPSIRDNISVELSAVIANAADFVPPRALDLDTLSQLGEYFIERNTFILNIDNVSRTEVEQMSFNEYQYRSYDANGALIENYYTYFDGNLIEAAGRLINNSAVGWSVVVPEEGLYTTTLLGASPWGSYYDETLFKSEGGNIYGLLIRNFEPTETAEQYLEIAASLEVTADIDGLRETTLSTQVTRQDLNLGNVQFELGFDGRRFSVSSNTWYTPVLYNQPENFELVNPSLNIVNQDGVMLDIYADMSSGAELKDTLRGTLVYNGTIYGTIERIKGLTIIRYIDGSGESIE